MESLLYANRTRLVSLMFVGDIFVLVLIARQVFLQDWQRVLEMVLFWLIMIVCTLLLRDVVSKIQVEHDDIGKKVRGQAAAMPTVTVVHVTTTETMKNMEKGGNDLSKAFWLHKLFLFFTGFLAGAIRFYWETPSTFGAWGIVVCGLLVLIVGIPFWFISRRCRPVRYWR